MSQGPEEATQDLKHFYQLKYTPPDPPPYPEFALDLFLNKIGSFDHCEKITPKEVLDVLATTKAGKSCGEDGVSYELLNQRHAL